MEFHVLMVEDDEADVLLMKVALEHADCDLHLHVVPDGPDALALLDRHEPYQNAPTPQLVLLDGHMPRMRAPEVLAHVRARWCHLPVVVFSGSTFEAEVQESLQAGANAYVTKPVRLDEYTQVVQTLLTCWCPQLAVPNT
ncbi:two-component system response regulator [Deinococcus malanensis]|uniref:Two-component system response regulator n=1 Tax=Deinococcus malanensis TaxID=1706855 RepID=A0ABQ2F221_9DEIO|nr:response regulator [Deinococcus malanensis]GGK42065.1 two-component system response regulator [Deinococcus malanensis]